MKIRLEYGENGLELEAEGLDVNVLRPQYPQPIQNEEEAFLQAARNPIESRPLSEKFGSDDRIAVVIPDITRPLPTARLLGWLFKLLHKIPTENVVILSGAGTHRKNTEAEWRRMVGDNVFEKYQCIDHEGENDECLAVAGRSKFGYDVEYNREYLAADKRILMGFVEPHFMAGFSGGYKAAFPGVASVRSIMKYHSAENIGHPLSSWGILDGNPTQEHVRAAGATVPVDFLINVTQDNERRITGFFMGDVIKAHDAGCAFCKETAMVKCNRLYPVVVTSNSGYPLDQNLYQTVKGISAASQILEPGGRIIVASRCNDGFPTHGNFRKFLFDHRSPEEMLAKIETPGFELMDQWQVQILARILLKGNVSLLSELDDEEVRRAHMTPITDLRQAIDSELQLRGTETPIAILPEGPLTIPYVSSE